MKAIIWFSFLAVLLPSLSYAQDWDVRPARQSKLIERYGSLALKHPQNSLFFKQWTRSLGAKGIKAEIERLTPNDRSDHQTLLLARLLAADKRGVEGLALLDSVGQTSTPFFVVRAQVALRAASSMSLGEKKTEHLRQRAIADLETAIKKTPKKREQRQLTRLCIDLLLESEQPHRTIAFFETLIALSPKDFSLQREFAGVLIENGDFTRAISLYQASLTRVRSGKAKAELLRDLGDVYERTNQFQNAEAHYRKAKSLARRGSWFRNELNQKLARLHRKLGSLHGFFPELEKEWRHTPAQWIALATIAQEVNDRATAMTYLKKLVRRSPKQIMPAKMLIKLYDFNGETDASRRVYSKLAKQRPRDPRVGADYANWLYYTAKDSDAARLELDRVRTLGQKPTSDVLAAETLLRWGLHQDALALLEEVEKSHPTDPLHVEVYGSMLAKLGQKDNALKVWSRLKTDILGTIRYGELAASKDYTDEAIEAFEQVVKERPKNYQIQRSLAELYEAESKFNKATALWEKIFHHTGDHKAVEKLVFLSRYDTTIAARFEKSFGAAPHWGLVLAEVAIAEGKPTDGLRILQETIQKSLATGTRKGRVTASLATRRSAEVNLQEMKISQAVLWWERLARNFPEHRIDGYRHAVRVSSLLPEHRAEPVLDRAAASVPFDAEVHAERAFRAAESSDFETAMTHMRKAIDRNPGHVEYRFELAYYLLQLGYADKARETYAEIVRWDRTGNDAIDAAFNALDLCRDATHVAGLEKKFRALENKIPQDAFVTIMLDVYNYIFFSLGDEALASQVAPHAVKILGLGLNSPYEEERTLALRMLALFDDASAFNAILAAAKEQSTEFSLSMLARSGNKRGIPMLRKALEKGDPKLRRIAWLGLVRAGDANIEKDLENALMKGPREDRIVAAWALRYRGEKSERILRTAWESETESTVRDVLVWALANSGDAGREAVVREMEHGKQLRAKIASVALSAVADSKTRTMLFSSLWSVDVRRYDIVLYGLSKHVDELQTSIWLDQVDEDVDPFELILNKITDAQYAPPDAPLAWSFEKFPKAIVSAADQALNKPASRERVLEDLLAVAYLEFEKPDDDIDRRANQVATVFEKLRPTLKEIVKTDPNLRFKACEAIPFAQDPKDLPFLLAQVEHTKTQEDITRLMAPIGFYAKSHVVPTLQKILKTGTESERLGAIAAVSSLRDLDKKERRHFARLIEGYVDTDGPMQVVAVEALGVLQDPDSLPVLADAFKRADSEKRHLILATVRRFDTPNARALHRKMTVVGVKSPCSGDPDDLSELLKGRCDAVFEFDDSE